MDNGNGFGNGLDLISVLLQLENLSLNEKQIDFLEKHLKAQDDKYLQKAIRQNEELLEQNKEIISLLKKLLGMQQ